MIDPEAMFRELQEMPQEEGRWESNLYFLGRAMRVRRQAAREKEGKNTQLQSDEEDEVLLSDSESEEGGVFNPQ